ncbi:hypothetical protein [Pontimicrobium sp. MEBiC06410]
MNKIKILIVLIILIIGCKSNSKNEEGYLELNKLEISKAKFNEHSIILSPKLLDKLYDKPIQIVDSCTTTRILPNQGDFNLLCHVYKENWDLVYRIHENTAFLGHLVFKNGLEIKFPQIILSEKTTINDIKKIYPNVHVNNSRNGSNKIEDIWFYDDLTINRRPDYNYIVLTFKNDKLLHFNYDWFPEYTDSQYEKYSKWMEKPEIDTNYLKANIFYGLKNLNNGFDVESSYYFSETDFEIVLKRIQEKGIIIHGIEPWLNGEFYDVLTYEDFNTTVEDTEWRKKALEQFKKSNKNLMYSATYEIPDKLLSK